jgi:hypothetical protein
MKKKIIIEDQIHKTNKIGKATLKAFTYEDIARYAIASIMGQEPKIITAIKKKIIFCMFFRILF